MGEAGPDDTRKKDQAKETQCQYGYGRCTFANDTPVHHLLSFEYKQLLAANLQSMAAFPSDEREAILI